MEDPPQSDHDNKDEVEAGWYPVAEATRLFELLKREGVRFSFETSDSGMKQVSTLMASLGGTFGQGLQVRVWVHRDDLDRFRALEREHFGPARESEG